MLRGHGDYVQVEWRRLRVGDIVYVADEEEFPADLLCLFAALPENVCFVQTANLDGETNLKVRRPVQMSGHAAEGEPLVPQSDMDVLDLRGRLLCEQPNSNLHRFNGKVEIYPPAVAARLAATERLPSTRRSTPPDVDPYNSPPAFPAPLATIPVSVDELLLRGCKLKNSQFVLGMVVYTGSDSRIVRNMARPPIKKGGFDRFLNVQIVVLMSFQACICVAFAVGGYVWRQVRL